MLNTMKKLGWWSCGVNLFNAFRWKSCETESCTAACLNLHQFAEALGNAVDARDSNLYKHSHDVAETARILAIGLGLSAVETELIHIAGHLHDIGKIGIPDAVLKKQGALDNNDWQWMRQHPEIGAEIVRPVPSFNTPGGVADIILSHHEFHNGSGYPHGLAGEAIPLGARIVAVADTLSALVRDRTYRRGCSFEAARTEISRCSGTQFDPAVVEILEINCLEVRDMLVTTNHAGTACASRGIPGLIFPEPSSTFDDGSRLLPGHSAPVAVLDLS